MGEGEIAALREGYEKLDGEFLETRRLPGPMAPDIEFDYSGATPDGLRGSGAEQFAEALGAWAGTFENWTVEPVEFIDAGKDQVLVAVRDGGRIKASGSDVSNEFFHLWTFRDGQAVRFAAFARREDALEAAKLEESSD